MAFFTPTPPYGADPGFANLFRLLDDFDSYSREARGNNPNNKAEGGNAQRHQQQHNHQPVRTFNPKFDVRETDTAFELYGELPSAERENIQIEFVDDNGLAIRGHIERAYSSHSASGAAAAITEKGDEHQSHKANVENENENEDSNRQVSKHVEKNTSSPPVDKFWLSERSVGEFSRNFTFPTRLDHDAVSASLDKGILTVVVPKAKKMEARRIAIQ